MEPAAPYRDKGKAPRREKVEVGSVRVWPVEINGNRSFSTCFSTFLIGFSRFRKVFDTAHLHGALSGFKRLRLTKFAEDAKARTFRDVSWRFSSIFIEFQWNFIKFHGFFMKFHGISLTFHVFFFSWFSVVFRDVFHGFPPFGGVGLAQARYEELAANGSVAQMKFRLLGETNSTSSLETGEEHRKMRRNACETP